MGYDFDIEYREGKGNVVADALSRLHEETQLMELSFSSIKCIDVAKIQEEVRQDPTLQKIIGELTDGQDRGKYKLQNGTLFYKERLVLSASSKLIPNILQFFHDGPMGGHGGYLKTLKNLAQSVYWRGMKKAVKTHVEECGICQQNKTSTLAPAGLLQPLPIPEKIWEELSMDFIEGLPKSTGYDSILVVVDRLSKYAHFLPLRHPFTTVQVANIFIKEVVRLHGIPKTIVSDRDKVFLSHFWQEIFRLQGTQLNFSSAYHPQTDGQSETVNKSLEAYLRCFTSDKPKEWANWIHWTEYCYNTSYHSALKETPFRIVYGRDPPTLLKYGTPPSPIAAIDQQLMDRDAMLDTMKTHLRQAQMRMKTMADRHRRELEFQEGELVFLRLKPYRMRSLARKLNEKLAPRYFGPFQVLRRVGQCAYRLELPPHYKLHPVFHVSQLKKAIGYAQASPTLPVNLTTDLEWVVHPVKALQFRTTSAGLEVLIQWDSLPVYEATWEPVQTIRQQFPTFNLEDKVTKKGGGIVKPPTEIDSRKPKVTGPPGP